MDGGLNDLQQSTQMSDRIQTLTIMSVCHYSVVMTRALIPSQTPAAYHIAIKYIYEFKFRSQVWLMLLIAANIDLIWWR